MISYPYGVPPERVGSTTRNAKRILGGIGAELV